ncbi:MAG TPA: hypothetical protein VM686_12890, partial [Polyangiaceae bacterium]|nr:hypothetical protein [Polyangiaceae bacterium]
MIAHQRLVDGADLLDVERAVRQALAAQDEQLLEHAEHGLVVDARDADVGARARIDDRRRPRLAGPALEERVLVRREQLAAAGGHPEVAVLGAEVDGAEQRAQPRVGPEASRHRVGVRAVVGLELLEQAEDAQVLGVELVFHGQQALVLGVQHEDQAQELRQQAAIQVIAR